MTKFLVKVQKNKITVQSVNIIQRIFSTIFNNKITIAVQNGFGAGIQSIGVYDDIKFVAYSVQVDFRDGSEGRPFASVTDAIENYGEPINQTDYERQVLIIVKDRITVNENLTFYTRRMTVVFQGGTLTGNITHLINNALRFGSSFSPTLAINAQTRQLGMQIIGNFRAMLATGGTQIRNYAGDLLNILLTGNYQVDDGVNGSPSLAVATSNNSQIRLENSSITGTFLGRNMNIALLNGGIVGNSELFDLLSSYNCFLTGSVKRYGTSILTRNINNLRLNVASSWENVNGSPRMRVDLYTQNQIFMISKVGQPFTFIDNILTNLLA